MIQTKRGKNHMFKFKNLLKILFMEALILSGCQIKKFTVEQRQPATYYGPFSHQMARELP
jgi:hypothetical protein